MLRRLGRVTYSHIQAMNNSLNWLYSRPFATTMTVFVIAIALTLPALFLTFNENIKQLTRNWQRTGQLSLYLKPTLSLADEIAFLAIVQATPGVGKATLKSPSDALKELQEQEGMRDILRYLPENPLPTVIDILPAASINTADKMQQLFLHLKSYEQVEQGKLDMQWINRLYAILDFIRKTANALMVLLALAVILIIGNTLRLAIHTRQEEIRVLKLIGASDAFIARPFLYSGIWYGLISAVLAIIFVKIFMLSLAVAIQELAQVYQIHFPRQSLSLTQAFQLCATAILLGWLGACLAVKKQLSLITPYN